MIQRLFPCLLSLLLVLSWPSGAAGETGVSAPHTDADRAVEPVDLTSPAPAPSVSPLTGRQIDEALEVLKRIDAEAAERLAVLKREHPQRVGLELRQRLPRIEHFLALRRYDPEMYELRLEDFRLAHESQTVARQLAEANQADDKKKADGFADQLEELVEAHFDVRQKIREHELALLEERIERLREQLEERADDRKEMIEQRIAELTREGAGAEW